MLRSPIVQNSYEILGAEGPLARHLPRFSARPSQQEMAEHIEKVLAEGGVFIAESGTGTGKTFAYLVPALMSGKRVVISTGTKHLQDQIFRRDLPRIRDALTMTVKSAQLKGRANYICLHRLENDETGAPSEQANFADYLAAIREWARATRSGDISEAGAVPEDASVWSRVTSTVETCLGSHCSRFDDCFVRKARQDAMAADILVINHHLFFADLLLKDEGFGQLLPGVDAIIFDEAHQMPEIASVFFGTSISRSQVEGLCRDIVTEEIREQSGVKHLRRKADAVHKAVADFRLALGKTPVRTAWDKIDGRKTRESMQTLFDVLGLLSEALEIAAGHGEGLASCYRRSLDILDRIDTFLEGSVRDHILWLETQTYGFTLYRTPLDVAHAFHERVDLEGKSWVFTSATLAVDDDFSHFQEQFGLAMAETYQWPSPFDFAQQTLLYLPDGLPVPSTTDYTRQMIEKAIPVLTASGGRTFILFTSHRALQQAAALLRQRVDYPLLVQGTAPRQELLERFRAAGNAVLLGTSSFWQGVDVRGEALSCVIIDKLPFAAPDDPVLRARGRALEQQGRNAFMEYQLPQAVIALKQGAGRLIRDEQDSGVLMLCDPRITSKGYGKIFLASLPPMPRTRSLQEVEKFFQQQDRTNVQAAV